MSVGVARQKGMWGDGDGGKWDEKGQGLGWRWAKARSCLPAGPPYGPLVLWRRTAAHAAWIPSTTQLDSLLPKHSCTALVNLLCEVCGPLRIAYGMLVGLEKVEKVVQTQAGEAGAVYGEGLEVDQDVKRPGKRALTLRGGTEGNSCLSVCIWRLDGNDSKCTWQFLKPFYYAVSAECWNNSKVDKADQFYFIEEEIESQ